jgi:hypothetical protein
MPVARPNAEKACGEFDSKSHSDNLRGKSVPGLRVGAT